MSVRSTTDPAATRYHVAFNHVPGIGPTRQAALVARFGDPEAAWHAHPRDLANVLDRRSLASLLETRARLDLDAVMARIAALGVSVVTAQSPAYPARLAELALAPPLLYVRGRTELLDTRSVAIVGTRKATPYGLRAARQLATDLAAAGLTVVSGLALGIDAAAHRATLDRGGDTVAVLGCGIDIEYPTGNRQLQRTIAERGAILSEQPPGAPPDAGNFPARNRIVSGLALAVVVVEAGERSGALITAGVAADQGRDVFAVPGSIFSKGSAGTHSLLASGAGVARSADDILAALDLASLGTGTTVAPGPPPEPTEARILECLGDGPLHIDDLIRRTGMGSGEVARALAVMEIKGMTQHVGNMRWVAAR
jgi:DNA processing protein